MIRIDFKTTISVCCWVLVLLIHPVAEGLEFDSFPPTTPPDYGQNIPINFGMSGSWYDPSTSGQGFIFDVIPDEGQFIKYWFTFDRESGGPERQRWYISDGTYQDGDHVVWLTVFQVTGGEFDSSPRLQEVEDVGSVMLEFHSCTEATLSYSLHSDTEQEAEGVIDLLRLSPDVMCLEITRPPPPSSGRALRIVGTLVGVKWNPPYYNNHAYTEIFAGETDSWQTIATTFESDFPVSESNETEYFVGTASGTQFTYDEEHVPSYFWVRFISTSGQPGHALRMETVK